MSSSLRFTGDREADDLLNNNFVALLIGMLLDQQFPIERAFVAPYRLQERLGFDLEAAALAEFPVEALIQSFSEKPALHRFPKSMAESCLLYTSPSPRDQRGSRMPSSA